MHNQLKKTCWLETIPRCFTRNNSAGSWSGLKARSHNCSAWVNLPSQHVFYTLWVRNGNVVLFFSPLCLRSLFPSCKWKQQNKSSKRTWWQIILFHGNRLKTGLWFYEMWQTNMLWNIPPYGSVISSAPVCDCLEVEQFPRTDFSGLMNVCACVGWRGDVKDNDYPPRSSPFVLHFFCKSSNPP